MFNTLYRSIPIFILLASCFQVKALIFDWDDIMDMQAKNEPIKKVHVVECQEKPHKLLSLFEGDFLHNKLTKTLNLPHYENDYQILFYLVRHFLNADNQHDKLMLYYTNLYFSIFKEKVSDYFVEQIEQIEEEEILFNLPNNCRFQTALTINGMNEIKINKSIYDQLSVEQKAIVQFEALTTLLTADYSPIHLRSYLYKVYTKSFLALSQQEQIRSLKRAGFISYSYASFEFDLTMPITFDLQGNITSAHNISDSSIWNIQGSCLTESGEVVKLGQVVDSPSLLMTDTLGAISFTPKNDCMIYIQSKNYLVAAGEEVITNDQREYVRITLAPDFNFDGKNYKLKSNSINLPKTRIQFISPLAFDPYYNDFNSYNNTPERIHNANGIVYINNESYKIKDNSSITLHKEFNTIESAILEQEMTVKSPSANFKVNGIILMRENKLVAGRNAEQNKSIIVQEKEIKIKDKSILGFYLSSEVKKFKIAQNSILLDINDEPTPCLEGMIITLSKSGRVIQASFEDNHDTVLEKLSQLYGGGN